MDKILNPKYLFNNAEIPKISPVAMNTSSRPIVEYSQSFFEKTLIFNAFIICFFPVFPSILTISIEKITRGINKKYPVINQYKAEFIIKLDFRNGSKVKSSNKK